MIMSTMYWSCFRYVGDAGNKHFVSRCWHCPGRDYGRYPGSGCQLSTLGVLHPGVPVMWYAHIRDLSPTAEAVKGTVCPM